MRISDLVNKVEPFKFEYDGFTLEGEWYKYKTATPKYAKELLAGIPEIPDGATEQERLKLLGERIEILTETANRGLADMIKSWNATDDNGEPVPLSAAVFESLPAPFTQALTGYFKERREEKKESAPSQSSS